jgi:hypothetical protein
MIIKSEWSGLSLDEMKYMEIKKTCKLEISLMDVGGCPLMDRRCTRKTKNAMKDSLNGNCTPLEVILSNKVYKVQ